MQVEIIVPLIFFASLTAIIAMPFYFKHRNRRLVFEAIKTHVEKTGTADPQLIDAITQENIGAKADLRRGLLLLFFAAGVGLCGYFIPSDDAGMTLIAIACIPALVGAAYVLFHFFVRREATV